MKVGKITQLTRTALGETEFNTPKSLGSAQITLEPAMLLKRIVDLETRLTNLALRVYDLENPKTKSARN